MQAKFDSLEPEEEMIPCGCQVSVRVHEPFFYQDHLRTQGSRVIFELSFIELSI